MKGNKTTVILISVLTFILGGVFLLGKLNAKAGKGGPKENPPSPPQSGDVVVDPGLGAGTMRIRQ